MPFNLTTTYIVTFGLLASAILIGCEDIDFEQEQISVVKTEESKLNTLSSLKQYYSEFGPSKGRLPGMTIPLFRPDGITTCYVLSDVPADIFNRLNGDLKTNGWKEVTFSRLCHHL